jgi:hypothetical protein
MNTDSDANFTKRHVLPLNYSNGLEVTTADLQEDVELPLSKGEMKDGYRFTAITVRALLDKIEDLAQVLNKLEYSFEGTIKRYPPKSEVDKVLGAESW